MSVDRGFTTPFTTTRSVEIVSGPPWHFCGETIHLEFAVEDTAFSSVLPTPLSVSPQSGPVVQVAFCSMSSFSEDPGVPPELRPHDANFQECLVKLRCRLGEDDYWFVAFSWVTGDVSLLRGYLQGFPKRLGQVGVSRFHSVHPAYPGRVPGARLGGWLSTPGGLVLSGVHTLEHAVTGMDAEPLPFILRRHIPDLADDSQPLADELVTPTLTYAADAEVWVGSGSLQCATLDEELQPLFTPIERVHSRSFVTACTITGTRVLAQIDAGS